MYNSVIKPLSKIILIQFLLFLSSNVLAQKIHSEYKFEKEKSGYGFLNEVHWNYYELDS